MFSRLSHALVRYLLVGCFHHWSLLVWFILHRCSSHRDMSDSLSIDWGKIVGFYRFHLVWVLALTYATFSKWSNHLKSKFFAASYDGNRFLTNQDGIWKVSYWWASVAVWNYLPTQIILFVTGLAWQLLLNNYKNLLVC